MFLEKIYLFLVLSSALIWTSKCQEENSCNADGSDCNTVDPIMLKTSCDQLEEPILLSDIDFTTQVCYFCQFLSILTTTHEVFIISVNNLI